MFKSGAVRIEKLPATPPIDDYGSGEVKIHVKTGQISALAKVKEAKPDAAKFNTEDSPPIRHLEFFIAATAEGIKVLIEIYDKLLERFEGDGECKGGIRTLREIAVSMERKWTPIAEKYPIPNRLPHQEDSNHPSESVSGHLRDSLFSHALNGTSPYEILVALQGLWMYLAHLESHFVALTPTAGALWSGAVTSAVEFGVVQVGRMKAWVGQQVKVRAPQTLLVPTRGVFEEEVGDPC
jgi:ferredoxin-nitrate reductase